NSGWLIRSARRLVITCTSGGENITLSKVRSLECPTGTVATLLPYRGYVCVRPLEYCESCGVGNPITPGTGIKLERSTDTAEGSLIPFTRYYHSSPFTEPNTLLNDWHSENRVGNAWREAFDMRIIPTTWGATTIT